MENKSQHWIPRSYLGPWCDSNPVPANAEPYVWCFPKKGGTGKRKAPRNLFEDSNFYTIATPDGQRDLSLEHGLAVLEERFRPIRSLIDERQEIGNRDKLWLCGFVAAMHWRTRSQRDAFRQQWGHVVAVAEDLQQALDRLTLEERRQQKPITTLGGTTGLSLTVDDARRLSAQPLQHMLLTAIEEDLRALAQMNLVVLTAMIWPLAARSRQRDSCDFSSAQGPFAIAQSRFVDARRRFVDARHRFVGAQHHFVAAQHVVRSRKTP